MKDFFLHRNRVFALLLVFLAVAGTGMTCHGAGIVSADDVVSLTFRRLDPANEPPVEEEPDPSEAPELSQEPPIPIEPMVPTIVEKRQYWPYVVLAVGVLALAVAILFSVRRS